MRSKLTKRMRELAPEGTRFCAGCQSYRDHEDFRGEKHTQCYACRSAKSHSSMVKRTYGIDGEIYARLLDLQSGGCAVCGARPRSKRLAVDHDHKKTGADSVRGLLCKAHNKDALGALHDSLAQVTALWHYLNTPPAKGQWLPLAEQPPLIPAAGAVSTPERAGDSLGIVTPSGQDLSRDGHVTPTSPGHPVALPVGAEMVPGKRGVWRVWCAPDSDAPF